MSEPRSHPETPEEIERGRVPGLAEVLCTEGVRYGLWDMTGRHRDHDPCPRRNPVHEEQERLGRRARTETAVAAVLGKAHERRAKGAMDALGKGPGGFHGGSFG